MNWQTLLTLLKGNKLLVTAFMAGISLGGWLLYAELCHAQQREDHKSIEQLVQIQRDAAIEKEAEAQQQKAKQEYIRAGCLTGKIKDVEDCGSVGVRIQ